MFYKKIYITSLLISNNIFYNFYLFLNIFFPKHFKDKIVNIKELNDKNYNNLLFLIYTEEIYEKYDIDLIKIKDMYYQFIDKYKNKEINKEINDNNEINNEINKDNISKISSINSSMNSSLCSSVCSSLNSSFYDEIDEE